MNLSFFPFTVELADLEHVDEATEVVRQTAKWLKTKGIHQWSESYPESRIIAEIQTQELYVILDQNKKLIGTLSLSNNKGDLWPVDNTPALYLHRLAIHREYSGLGLGARIIQWARLHASQKQSGRLRLNCDKSNPFLTDFYKSCGFILIGEFMYEPWKMTFNLFEMPV